MKFGKILKLITKLKFLPQETIIIRGNKSRYGSIVGSNGAVIKNLKLKYKNTFITIPSKDISNNEIKIKGFFALQAVFDIIKMIQPN